jgi:hypothetical protein
LLAVYQNLKNMSELTDYWAYPPQFDDVKSTAGKNVHQFRIQETGYESSACLEGNKLGLPSSWCDVIKFHTVTVV